jgi:glycosyltransferase involved in cell wall biosynthesis
MNPYPEGVGARHVMFSYWGTRGALPKLTLDLAHVYRCASREIHCTFSLSPFNELFGEYGFLVDDLLAVPMFKNKWRAFVDLPAIVHAQSRVKERLRRDNIQAFVSLMPHIWSPLLAAAIRRAGARHTVVVHDADPHPGDISALVNSWLIHEAHLADHVITLSKFVAQRLTIVHHIPQQKISVLFHPDLSYRPPHARPINLHEPLRILFFGRILPYRGLGLLVDAVEALCRKGVSLQLGVYGKGKIDPLVDHRLSMLGAKVVNRWLSNDEIPRMFSCYDVLVAAHMEASQSGVIAAAFGAGVPVIATPVGGLVEQVIHGVTGIVAQSVESHAIAHSIRRVAENRALLAQFRKGISATREKRSMELFFQQLCKIAVAES